MLAPGPVVKLATTRSSKEIVKATNDNLAIRDDIFNNDPNKTPEKKILKVVDFDKENNNENKTKIKIKTF